MAIALRLSVAQLATELGEQQIAVERWTSLASDVTDPTLRATAYLGASRAALHLVERKTDAFPLLEAAQGQPTDDPVLAVEIESHRANLLQVVKHQAEEGRRAAYHAAEKARRLWGAPPVEITARERDAYVATLQVAFDAAVVEEDGAAQLRIADELSHAARGSDEGAVWADHDHAAALMFAGRVRESVDNGRRAWNRARERMLPMLTLTSGANLLSKLLDAGQFDEADEVISECLELEQRVAGAGERFAMSKVGNWSIHSLRHEAWLYRGDWRDAMSSLEREILRQPEAHFRMHLHWHIFVWLARCAGPPRSQDVDLHVGASREDALAADCRRCARELKLKTAEAYARLGRNEDAEQQLRSWDERGRGALLNDALWRRHIAGLIAVAKHDPTGIAELEAVLAEQQRLGLIASLLWTRLDLAAALQASNSRRAAEEFRQVGELAASVGASTVEQMADLGLRRMGVRTWRRGLAGRGEQPLDKLSERERQIAALIAAGHSNPEIASRLFLSRKTVERHVSNILARTGTRNRTDLARRLTAQN
ncbi:MAG TPA: LuxR C-terminal-related transcriptional regulator [Candidatus Dormibacteraeota bacterium]|nr:LuxR C-terminal-related transcriptional regulator [Candidatus Dormibacteraeota bacterium]